MDTDPAGEREASAEPPDGGRDGAPVRRLVWWRRVAVAVWAAATAVWVSRNGIPLDRETIIVITVVGLLVWSLGRRPLWSVLVDWLPFVAVLVLYDYTRGLAAVVGAPTQWLWQVDVDRVVGFGSVPTTWLQEHLKQGRPPWWEGGVSLVYLSFYFVPYLLAGRLWLRGRAEFRRFAVRFVALSFLGVVVFVAMPAAPPWAASQCTVAEVADHPSHPPCMDAWAPRGVEGNGLLGPYETATADPAVAVQRLSGRGFGVLHLRTAGELLHKGQASVNLVAAIPSLHAGITLLVTLFLWPRVRRGWRVLLAVYPLAMAFTLVYTAEHYVTDILIGWALAVLLELVVRRVEARRSRRGPLPDRVPGRGSGVVRGEPSLP
ncbi:phosphatase PAP2 family protein [Jatrophihabitans sp. YIM 134969]